MLSRSTSSFLLVLAFRLSLTLVTCANVNKEVAHQFQPATQQRNFAVSSDGSGDAVSSGSHRQLEKEVTSDHLIRLEYSGVTYASVSLDQVKAHLTKVVEDTLTAHLESGIEVIDVSRAYVRKLLSSPRRLSYILLTVKISFRHPSWISSERILDTTLEILNKYVDQDFRNYMRSLPGNGDYFGSVHVRVAFNEFSIGFPTTAKPISSPVQGTTTGSFQFALIFNGISPDHGNAKVFINYVRYSIMEILNENLEYEVELVDVSLQPLFPTLYNVHQESLNFQMLIVLRYQSSRNYAFDHVDGVLSRNIAEIEFHRNDYITSSFLSKSEIMELDSTLREVFGETDGIEINKGRGSKPTQAPTKSIKPAKGWFHGSAYSLEMPWWSWVILGAGLASISMCCCCCILKYMRRKRNANAKESATMKNSTQLGEPDIEPNTIHHQDTPGDVMNAKGSDTFHKQKKNTTYKKQRNKGVKIPLGQNTSQSADRVFLYRPNQSTNFVHYDPNPSAPDPDERIVEPKCDKKKKKQKKPREP